MRSSVSGWLAVGLLGLLGLLPACSTDSRTADQSEQRRNSGAVDDPAAPGASGEAAPVVASIVHRDESSGLPRFAWIDLADGARGRLRGKPARDAAWITLRGLGRAYALTPAVMSSFELEALHDVGAGPIIARFRQRVDGIDVFSTQLSLAFTRDLEPVAASGALARVPRAADRRAFAFAIAARDAVAAAAQAAGTKVKSGDVTGESSLEGGYSRHSLARGALGGRHEVTPTRAKKVWFDGAKGLAPAYYVEVHLGGDATNDATLQSFVVSAVDGAILFTNDMSAADAYSYRVYADVDGPHALFPYPGPQGHGGLPHPTGRPDRFQAPFVASNLVTLASAPFSQNDPWLPPGATVTSGNNVEAFANLVAPDGFQAGDVRATTSAPNVFDYAYDHGANPGASDANVQAGTTQLFYTVNAMHDWFYDAGWNEAARNPQADNYGRGGVGGDPIVAQAQGVGGRNNANAFTPADGASPVIRMYIWDGKNASKLQTSTGDKAVGTTSFGPSTFTQAGVVALASPALACSAPLDNAADLAGKIALVRRGGCSAIVKVANAQSAGAIAVLIEDDRVGPPPGFTAGPEVDPATITVPALGITQADGAALETALEGAAPVLVTLSRVVIDHDGALDASVVSHEWGHVLSNRLIGNGNGIRGTQARGMGEGWSDFVALLMITRPEDAAVPSNPDWSGSYAMAAYDESGAGDGYYYGTRRVPYSVDFAKDPLTFKHVEDGVTLPPLVPVRFGRDGAQNAEVHATGEVWATMLWECYVALLRDGRYTFDQANDRMRKYLVASLELTPNIPTFTEARDAVLAAAYATDKQDFEHFALAFARRGAGVGAKAPPKTSTTNAGVVESFASGADVEIVAASVAGTASACNPYGILRNGEQGTLTVTLHNLGTAPLIATTMTLSSTAGKIGFPDGAVVNVPAIAPFRSATITAVVSMQAAATGETLDTQIDVTDPDLVVPRTVSFTVTGEYNYDVGVASSTVDAFDTPVTAWTVTSDPALDTASPWRLVPEARKQRWSLLDRAATSDHSLVTPALVVGNDPFAIVFDHRYVFEASNGKFYDGAVLELSSDGGATWSDIGALAVPGYDGLLELEGSDNPLAGRAAFVGTSAGHPAYTTTRVELGVGLAGATVKARFRVGTDQATGAAGWDITSVRVEGITNAPFVSRVAVGVCE